MHKEQNITFRWSRPEDTERIAEMASYGFSGRGNMPTERMAATVRRLMRGDCSSMTPYDFCLMEDHSKQSKNPIVACLCDQRYEWLYDGIPLRCARPEVVSSLESYRHQGLVRSLFAEFHRKTQEEGIDIHAIVGIPYFYHKLGYTYGVDLEGKCIISLPSIQPYLQTHKAVSSTVLRDATLKDIAFVQRCYNSRRKSYLLWQNMSDAQWAYYIEAGNRYGEQERIRSIKIITNAQGHPLGFLLTQPIRWWKTVEIYALELAPNIPWSETMPAILSALQTYAMTMPTEDTETVPAESIEFALGQAHPSYDVLNELQPLWKQPDAWYIRIPQPHRLLTKIAPTLNTRLQSSVLSKWTGVVKINLYTSGVRITINKGRISRVDPWQKDPYAYDADISLAPQQFWQLILGYRSIDQLLKETGAPDILLAQKEADLLRILFPSRVSFVLKVDFK